MSARGQSLAASRGEIGEPSSESPFVFDLALPDDDHGEAKFAHRVLLAGITRLVRADLLAPPMMIGLWKARERA